MIVIALEVFVSLMLVAGSILLFIWTVRSRTLEHSDRMALAPLHDDERRADPATSEPPSTTVEENRR
jgi:nitrogen fixation-related uncharacterized protein